MAAVPADPAALYERHRAWLLRRCTWRLHSRADGEDAVQQTFLYALAALERGVVPRDEAAWLSTIADNVCRAARKRAARRESAGDIELLPAPERGEATAAELASALAELPPGQRSALLLREWRGLSYREIAATLETSEAAVETLLFRARRRAAAALANGRRVLDLGAPLSALRSLLATAAGKAGAVAVVGSIAVGATAAALPHPQRHASAVRHRVAAQRPGSAPPAVLAPSVRRSAAPARLRRPHRAARRGGHGVHVPPAAAAAAPAPAPAPSGPAPNPVAAAATRTSPRPADTVAAAPPPPTAPAAPAPAPAPAPPPAAPGTTAATTTTVTSVVPATVDTVTSAVAPVTSTADSVVSQAQSTLTGAVATVTSSLSPLPTP